MFNLAEEYCDRIKSSWEEDKTLWKFKEPVIQDVLAGVKAMNRPLSRH